MSPKKRSTKPTKTSRRRAALRGWAKRRAGEARRSASALKSWETRRKLYGPSGRKPKKLRAKRSQLLPEKLEKKAQPKKIRNREYYIFIHGFDKKDNYFSDRTPDKWHPVTEGKTEEAVIGAGMAAVPRVLVIFDKDASERAVIAFAIYRIESYLPEEWQWVRYMLQGGNRRLVVASGSETSEAKGVHIGKA